MVKRNYTCTGCKKVLTTQGINSFPNYPCFDCSSIKENTIPHDWKFKGFIFEEGEEEKYLTILRNPNLFDNLINELDKKIVDEKASRKVIVLNANGRLVQNCQVASYNLLINDDAGTGKDYI